MRWKDIMTFFKIDFPECLLIIPFSELNWTCLQMLFTVKASQVLVPGKPFEQLIGNFAANATNYEKYILSGFMKTVSKNLHPTHVFFFSPKSTTQKLRNICVFPLYLFIVLLLLSFLYFVPLLRGLDAAFRSWEIKVHVGYLWEIIDTVFINLVIYKLQEHRVKITLDAFVQN